MLSVVMQCLILVILCIFKLKVINAEYWYAVSYFLKMLNVIMLKVVMLRVTMLSVFMLNVVMLIVTASLQRIYSKRMKIKSCRMSGQFQLPSVRLIQNTGCPVKMNRETLRDCYDLNVFLYTF